MQRFGLTASELETCKSDGMRSSERVEEQSSNAGSEAVLDLCRETLALNHTFMGFAEVLFLSSMCALPACAFVWFVACTSQPGIAD